MLRLLVDDMVLGQMVPYNDPSEPVRPPSWVTQVVPFLSSDYLYGALLTVLFLISFAIPLFFAARIGGVWDELLRQSPEPEQRNPDLFTSSIALLSEGTFIRVKNNPLNQVEAVLDPAEGKDIFVTVTFKPRRLPVMNERMMLWSRIDASRSPPVGMQLLLSRDTSGVRPLVYWRSEHGEGEGWYTFPEVELALGAWAQIVLSHREGRFLGLHATTYTEDAEREGKRSTLPGGLIARQQVLGGYELSPSVFPTNQADLLIGPFNNHTFRGTIGAFGIFISSYKAIDFNALLKALAEDPRALPHDLSGDEVRLWISGEVRDLSFFKGSVSLERNSRPSHKESSGE